MNGERSHNKESVLFCEHLNHLMRQHMRRSTSLQFLRHTHGVTACGPKWLGIITVVAVAFIMCPRPANAIEMFTFFGDGSRVPLPSLETPIEAYPGIPLRSDRLRAQRRTAYRVPAQTGVPIGNGRITIRAVPSAGTAPEYNDNVRPAPAPERIQTPPPSRNRRVRWRRQ